MQFSFRSIKKKCMKSNYINAEISSRKDLYIDLEKVVLHPLTNIIRKRYSGFPTMGTMGKKKKRRSIIRNERSKCERKFNCKLIYRRS